MSATRTVGVGVFVRKQGRILLGKRGPACPTGVGCWALPGGRSEELESVIETGLREVMEETGLAVRPTRGCPMAVPGLLAVTDHVMEAHADDKRGDHCHLSFWLLVDWVRGDPLPRERDKCREWRWVYPDWAFKVPGADDPASEQFFWTPVPLWRRILEPHFSL